MIGYHQYGFLCNLLTGRVVLYLGCVNRSGAESRDCGMYLYAVHGPNELVGLPMLKPKPRQSLFVRLDCIRSFLYDCKTVTRLSDDPKLSPGLFAL